MVKKIIEKIIGLWNIYGGIIASILIAWFVDFSKNTMDAITSFLILNLTCISTLTFLKITLFKKKSTLIDKAVVNEKSVKTMKTAIDPLANGEEVGKAIIKTAKEVEVIMEKIKIFFEKFKGYILSIALIVLTIIEYCGGFINDLCNGVLTVNGVEILPIITLVCANIVGLLSNTNDKATNQKIAEFKDKLKQGTAKDITDELVLNEIKKTLKESESNLKDKNKAMEVKNNELALLETHLNNATNTYNAKVKMLAMNPPIATEEDVESAKQVVVESERNLVAKKAEINNLQAEIDRLKTMINALKSQL